MVLGGFSPAIKPVTDMKSLLSLEITMSLAMGQCSAIGGFFFIGRFGLCGKLRLWQLNQRPTPNPPVLPIRRCGIARVSEASLPWAFELALNWDWPVAGAFFSYAGTGWCTGV